MKCSEIDRLKNIILNCIWRKNTKLFNDQSILEVLDFSFGDIFLSTSILMTKHLILAPFAEPKNIERYRLLLAS